MFRIWSKLCNILSKSPVIPDACVCLYFLINLIRAGRIEWPETRMYDQTGHAENAAEIIDLTRYYGDLLAVDHLNIKIRRGEVLGLLGPNGAGKTTTINMFCGLLKPSEGKVVINGRPLIGKGPGHIRPRVGICPQENILWPKLSCFEQLVFMARMYDMKTGQARQRSMMLLDQLGLMEKRNKMAQTLSGGMLRRMNVAMALVQDPEFVVFDEPEAGLDPQSRVLVRDFIISTAREKTVIFTTHNMDEADRVSDRVAIMDRGRLLKLDRPDNLKRSVGEGDILEIHFQDPDMYLPPGVGDELEKMGLRITARCGMMIARAGNMMGKVHDIYKVLEKHEIRTGEMNMRGTSLEDVFIELTGRSLRQ